VYGTVHDTCLKSLMAKTTDVRNLEKHAGLISETLAEIITQVGAEAAQAEAIDDADAPASADSKAEIQIITVGHETVAVALHSLSKDQRARFDQARTRCNQQVAALIRPIPRDLADAPDLAMAIKNTEAGTYDPNTHDGRAAAVVFDSKLAGEASSKAPQRLPPFQQDECRRMLEAVRGRRGAEDALPDGDLYMFLDGGRGIMDRMTSYFISNTHVSTTIHLHLEPGSVTKRLEQVRDASVHNTHETTNICASQWPRSLRSRSHRRYSGSTATHGHGPIVLPDVSSLWHVLRPVKEDMYGEKGLIPVGGERPARMPPRVRPKNPGHPPRHAHRAVPEQASLWLGISCRNCFGMRSSAASGSGPSSISHPAMVRWPGRRCTPASRTRPGVHPGACGRITAKASVLRDRRGDP